MIPTHTNATSFIHKPARRIHDIAPLYLKFFRSRRKIHKQTNDNNYQPIVLIAYITVSECHQSTRQYTQCAQDLYIGR